MKDTKKVLNAEELNKTTGAGGKEMRIIDDGAFPIVPRPPRGSHLAPIRMIPDREDTGTLA